MKFDCDENGFLTIENAHNGIKVISEKEYQQFLECKTAVEEYLVELENLRSENKKLREVVAKAREVHHTEILNYFRRVFHTGSIELPEPVDC